MEDEKSVAYNLKSSHLPECLKVVYTVEICPILSSRKGTVVVIIEHRSSRPDLCVCDGIRVNRDLYVDRNTVVISKSSALSCDVRGEGEWEEGRWFSSKGSAKKR